MRLYEIIVFYVNQYLLNQRISTNIVKEVIANYLA